MGFQGDRKRKHSDSKASVDGLCGCCLKVAGWGAPNEGTGETDRGLVKSCGDHGGVHSFVHRRLVLRNAYLTSHKHAH